MTTQTDPTRILAEEVAALRRDLAGTRVDLDETRAYITKLVDVLRGHDETFLEMNTSLGTQAKSLQATQDWLWRMVAGIEDLEKRTVESFREFRTFVENNHHTLDATGQRVDRAEDLLRLAHEDTCQLRDAVTQCVAKLEEHQTTMSMWIGHLAHRVLPEADAIHEELERIFPKGFTAIPYNRLPSKKSDS
jgi:ABC-type transporter Mla subunit MlaD